MRKKKTKAQKACKGPLWVQVKTSSAQAEVDMGPSSTLQTPNNSLTDTVTPNSPVVPVDTQSIAGSDHSLETSSSSDNEEESSRDNEEERSSNNEEESFSDNEEESSRDNEEESSSNNEEESSSDNEEERQPKEQIHTGDTIKGLSISHFEELPEQICLGEHEVDDVNTAWGHALVGFVAGQIPGKAAIVSLCASWKVGVEYFFHNSGWIIFRFEKEEDKESICNGGPCSVSGRPLLLKNMPQYFEFDHMEMIKMPVWTTLPGLPLECWNAVVLGKITSKVGIPIITDALTASKGRISYARVLVEVDASKPLTRSVSMKLPTGKVRAQPILYEYEPKFCSHCKSVMHNVEDCKEKQQLSNYMEISQPAVNAGTNCACSRPLNANNPGGEDNSSSAVASVQGNQTIPVEKETMRNPPGPSHTGNKQKVKSNTNDRQGKGKEKQQSHSTQHMIKEKQSDVRHVKYKGHMKEVGNGKDNKRVSKTLIIQQ